MSFPDLAIVIAYFVLVIGLGFWYARRAARGLDAYFLGGKRLHWLALAMSGSVSNFDIAGTMWIVSIIYVLGMKSMWHHWMWGFMLGAFFMAYMGKWVRRSGVMTAAEWMRTRFGDGTPGRVARVAYALMAVCTLASFIGYAYQGIGKFAAVYVPLERLADGCTSPFLASLLIDHEAAILALFIIGLTTFYVLLGGLFSVVVTDVVQTVVLTLGALYLSWLGWSKMGTAELASLPEGFASLRVPWRIPEFAGTDYAGFEFFGALVIIWVIKGLLLNAGGPGQMYDFQRFLAARNPRDACKVGAAWSLFLIPRWGMAMGIALIALTGVAGAVDDPEKVMPLVLRDFLPVGIRGLVVAGLLAAFMSTFSSTVNSGAAFIVRDLWQLLVRPNPTEREAMRMSYAATVGIVLLGLFIGFQGDSIAQIWGWMMMALGAGVIVPNVLRWYWWRLNGWGYAAGTAAGILLSTLALFVPETPQWTVFGVVVTASLVASVGVSLSTRPVDAAVLRQFYVTLRPFGWWAPVLAALPAAERPARPASERASVALLNVVLGMVAVAGLYLFPMFLVAHFYLRTGLCVFAALLSMVLLKFTWYDTLGSVEETTAPPLDEC